MPSQKTTTAAKSAAKTTGKPAVKAARAARPRGVVLASVGEDEYQISVAPSGKAKIVRSKKAVDAETESETAELEAVSPKAAPAIKSARTIVPAQKVTKAKTGSSTDRFIVVKGARQHNLKNIDISIPRDKLIVITGLSGSGKSSLAFDTIYAEGQRRYVESLSAYARQFLGQMDKPDVDFIEGLSPAVSIDQKTASRNPRSTVATVTEIYDYLRLLFARIGVPHSPTTGRPIVRQSVDQIVDRIMKLDEGARLHILAPIVRGRKGEYRKLLDDYRKKGFARARVNGEIFNLDELDDLKLERYEKHNIEVVVDRAVVRPDARGRIADSVSTALQLGEGILFVEIVVPEDEADRPLLMFSEKLADPETGESFEELEPRTFSFNSPYGACPECSGLGTHLEFDPHLVLPDLRLSIDDGAVVPWKKTGSNYKREMLRSLARDYGFKTDQPISELTEDQINVILFGTDSTKVRVSYVNMHGRRRAYDAPFEGVLASLQNEYAEYGDKWREELQKYQSDRPCAVCKGKRLKPFPLAVTIKNKNIADVTAMSVAEAHEFFTLMRGASARETTAREAALLEQVENIATGGASGADLSTEEMEAATCAPQTKGRKRKTVAAEPTSLVLNERDTIIARPILKEIQERLQFMVDVGLGYLTLNRTANTLAGGEAQRIRLATQIGSGLVGVLYVLDEPSIGLHQRDNEKLLQTLVRLRDLGNTVIVVEHDEETMREADHIVDIGPAAGEAGGQVVAQGTLQDIMACDISATGRFLSGKETIPFRRPRRAPSGFMKVLNARENNLRGIDVEVPLGCFVCVTGVSGSGKSTLVEDIISKRLAHDVSKQSTVWGKHDGIEGWEQIDKIINIDQSPIGRTPRSNPATYTGAFTPLRELFQATREAKQRGYGPGRFSFNVKGGRCENCQGDGIIKIEMHFLPDVYVPCEVCSGKRYNRETLEVKYKGQSISDVLDMTVQQASETFVNIPSIARKMGTICDVGLGYIRMGQPATTLSGGEAQRVKLATELSKRGTGHTLYILDEPSVGLHMADVKVLIEVLQRLTDQGNTVLVIEHNLDLIACADYLIDMGPEGGSGGGQVIARGTPEEVIQNKKSHTGRFLEEHFNRHP